MNDGVEYRILGPLEVYRDGARVQPTSPKQKALLVDLLINRGRAMSRDRLVDDLWADNPPATAHGVLQNYVSALRKALGPEAIETVGQGYVIVVEPGRIDVDRFEALVDAARVARGAGDATAMRQHSAAAIALWRGDALLDVAYEPFARAAIAELQARHGEAIELRFESEILGGTPRDAIPGLEAAVALHPLREHLWGLLMLARYQSGQQAEALRTFERARRAVIDQLGLEPSASLRELERAILTQDPALTPAAGGVLSATVRWAGGPEPVPRAHDGPRSPALVGRQAETAAVLEHLHASWADRGRGLCLLRGQAGIGKTRLLEEAHRAATATGSTVLSGRSYEAETGRPFGVWIDALRSADLGRLPGPLRAELTPLVPELTDERPDVDDHARLHDAVSTALAALAATTPVTLLVDDLQWIDESSASLLHYVMRHSGQPLALFATARPAELAANAVASRLVEALRRDDQLVQIELGPLDATAIAELTGPIAPDADRSTIAQACNGNPLFALEMARGLARGDDVLTSRLDALIGDRLGRLSDDAAILVPWLAAFGRSVEPSLLAGVVNRPVEELIAPLGEMERHGVLTVRADGGYDFDHDLVRTAAYKRQSTPKRAMLHARIGVVLEAAPDPDDTRAADAARHADAGGDSATCARACVRAARRCLRLGAHGEAEEHAVRGRAHARRLSLAQRIPLDLQLIHTLLHPALRLHDPGDLGADLTELCAEAQRLAMRAELSSGLYLLARVHHWGWSDIPRARALMQRALDVLDVAGGPDVEPIFEGARCLAYLEIEMERTTELFEQLAGLHDLATRSHQYQWGLGLVRAWNGDLDGARRALGQAIVLASASDDHWATFECSTRLALLEIDADDLTAAGPLVDGLRSAADRLGPGGSEATFASAIMALHRLGDGPWAPAAFVAEVAALEAIDARFLVPDLLNSAAIVALRRRRLDDATNFATQAIDVAAAVDKPTEGARGHAILACVAAAETPHRAD
jgi:DNA-binding SARP family transcriptional activator/tetratricopeptide (TPR) repeat protein